MNTRIRLLLIVLWIISLCTMMACVRTLSPPKYLGPQSAEALFKEYGKLASNPKIDAKYPQTEWVNVLLKKGIVIENYTDYTRSLSGRWELVRLENQPAEWESGKYGIPPSDDWDVYKSAYIDRKIWEYQQRKAAEEGDSSVVDVLFTGPDHKIALPLIHNRVYVRRGRGTGVFMGTTLSKQQEFDLLFKGKHPRGYDIIYINESGDILSEKPLSIKPEDLGLSEAVTWPPRNQEHLDLIFDEAKNRYRQRYLGNEP